MKINRRKRRYFGVIMLCVLIGCFTLTSCSLLRLFGIGNDEGPVIGGDPSVWRGYSEDYVLSDNMTVCFSSLDSRDGYAVYESASFGRIGSLILPESLSLDDIKSGIEIEDYNGDGLNDAGIITNDGAVIQYIFVPDDISTWPDKVGGCFTRIDEEGGIN